MPAPPPLLRVLLPVLCACLIALPAAAQELIGERDLQDAAAEDQSEHSLLIPAPLQDFLWAVPDSTLYRVEILVFQWNSPSFSGEIIRLADEPSWDFRLLQLTEAADSSQRPQLPPLPDEPPALVSRISWPDWTALADSLERQRAELRRQNPEQQTSAASPWSQARPCLPAPPSAFRRTAPAAHRTRCPDADAAPRLLPEFSGPPIAARGAPAAPEPPPPPPPPWQQTQAGARAGEILQALLEGRPIEEVATPQPQLQTPAGATAGQALQALIASPTQPPAPTTEPAPATPWSPPALRPAEAAAAPQAATSTAAATTAEAADGQAEARPAEDTAATAAQRQDETPVEATTAETPEGQAELRTAEDAAPAGAATTAEAADGQVAGRPAEDGAAARGQGETPDGVAAAETPGGQAALDAAEGVAPAGAAESAAAELADRGPLWPPENSALFFTRLDLERSGGLLAQVRRRIEASRLTDLLLTLSWIQPLNATDGAPRIHLVDRDGNRLLHGQFWPWRKRFLHLEMDLRLQQWESPEQSAEAPAVAAEPATQQLLQRISLPGGGVLTATADPTSRQRGNQTPTATSEPAAQRGGLPSDGSAVQQARRGGEAATTAGLAEQRAGEAPAVGAEAAAQQGGLSTAAAEAVAAATAALAEFALSPDPLGTRAWRDFLERLRTAPQAPPKGGNWMRWLHSVPPPPAEPETADGAEDPSGEPEVARGGADESAPAGESAAAAPPAETETPFYRAARRAWDRPAEAPEQPQPAVVWQAPLKLPAAESATGRQAYTGPFRVPLLVPGTPPRPPPLPPGLHWPADFFHYARYSAGGFTHAWRQLRSVASLDRRLRQMAEKRQPPAPDVLIESLSIREERKVESGEIHYFDHPAFGVVAVIEELTPEAWQEILAQQTEEQQAEDQTGLSAGVSP